MDIQDHIKSKKAFLFAFDDVLYPQKDYLLQVYYLFSEFLTYSELQNATEILNFMKIEFEQNGVDQIFEKTAEKFNIPLKYNDNFKLLHQTARLPLKLLLFQQILSLLQELVVERKEIFLVLDGDPAIQLNKVKQTEWHDLESYLKLYFVEEYNSVAECVQSIIHTHELNASETVFIGNNKETNLLLKPIEVDYFFVTNLL
jgi:FMN phosphatase YigB (HAD superfamily)